MKAVRALLACLWMLFGFTATTHAGMGLPVAEQPCHEQAAEHHPQPEPRSQQGLMPCCGQPVVIAPAETFIPSVTRVEYLSLAPERAERLFSLMPAFELPPPKPL